MLSQTQAKVIWQKATSLIESALGSLLEEGDGWVDLDGTSMQSDYIVPFTLVHTGKYRTEDKLKIHTIQKLNITQKKQQCKSQQKNYAWFSRFLWHLARKRGGLILQCSRSHMGLMPRWLKVKIVNGSKIVEADKCLTSAQPEWILEPSWAVCWHGRVVVNLCCWCR